jgi:membrane fusion protein, multidrug efflux system
MRRLTESAMVTQRVMIMRLPFLAVYVLAGLAVVTGCQRRVAENVVPPLEVTVSRPIVRQVTDYFEFPGQTEAISEVAIRARVTGYITKVNFEDGQNVKSGQLLFEIDPRPYQAVLDRARGDLTRLEAICDKARVDVARSERLRPSGAVSADEHEQRLAQLKIAKASLAAVRAAVTEAELNLEFTRIVSPIDGRVGRARIREGNLVQTGADSPILTTVVTINPIYVSFNVDEHALLQYQEIARRSGKQLHFRRLKELQVPVEIGLMTEEGFPHKGILDFADNKINRGTGTICIRGLFKNDNEYLTPGEFVRVRIPFGEPHQALLVEESALSADQRLKYLLVVNKDKKVERRNVQLGRLQDGLRVIQSGIGPDDLVIMKALQRARPGDEVVPKEKAADAKGLVSEKSETRMTNGEMKMTKEDPMTKSKSPRGS